MSHPGTPLLAFLILAWCGSPCLAQPATPSGPQVLVGMSVMVEVIVPGGELEPIPLEDRTSPMVLRTVAADATANGFHYRLDCVALEPGTFDLRRHLRWKNPLDKAPIPDRPEWHLVVGSALPPGQVIPHELDPHTNLNLGGYRLILWVASTLWVTGLVVILLWRGKGSQAPAHPGQPETLADRLRPLVEAGLRGELGPARQAELERILLAYWRRKLGLDQAGPADALRHMKAHPEAGALLRSLEQWLHQPPHARQPVAVEEMLKPYRQVSVTDLGVAP